MTAKSRQISYTSGDTNASYTYYPNGMRCSKYVNGKTATYYWNSNGSMVFETCGNNEKDYYFGGSLFVTDGLFCFTNAHGDVIALFDDDGTITKRYEYDAFGNELTPDESDTNPYRYCSEYFDKETGTIYLRARYYNPAHGRFTQLDPARDGLNWYVYCANNPIIYIDPFGLENLVVAGGAYHAGSGKEYQYEFVDSALLQIASLDGDATLLVANAGWTDDQHDKISEAAAERDIKLVWFDKTDELVDYINNGDGNRKDDPIESFYVFAHRTDSGTGKYGITFGLYSDKNEQLKLYTDDISSIEGYAFASESKSVFYSCRAGNNFENGNFGKKWAWITGSRSYAYAGANGRCVYTDILGNRFERAIGSGAFGEWRSMRGDVAAAPGEAYRLPQAAAFSSLKYFAPMVISSPRK